MKSRITWLVKGDKNTTFYHTSAPVRQSRIRITCLKYHMGNWFNEERDIADFIRNGYSELFMSSHSRSLLSLWDPPCWNSCLKEEDAAKLAVPISNEEISSALLSLKAFRAPGPRWPLCGVFLTLLASSRGVGKKGSETNFHLPNNVGVPKQDPYHPDPQVQYT